MPWPEDTREALDAFYSRHKLDVTGRPTTAWETANLTRITVPYPLTLSWDLSKQVTRVMCHKKVADSMLRIFTNILSHYGSIDEVKKARMHLFGGCYNFRAIKGSSRLSTHSWGAGIDIDPEKNPLGRKYDPSRGMMPEAVIKLFEAEGWAWGGRWTKRPDCMHFQATS